MTVKAKYDNLLPSLDFNIEVLDNVVARTSFSQTLARADYGNLFASVTAGAPNRPTALGAAAAGANVQDPGLLPLESDNFDVSLEWYYKPSSYISIGFFNKNVRNFIGTQVTNGNLFGLRDPSSGAPGTRSGTALAYLTANDIPLSDINLFAYTALLVQNNGNQAAATAQFQANYTPGTGLGTAFYNTLATAVDIVPDASDPLFNFAISGPVNNREGNIHGFEVAWTHFFGQTGFGFSASYTKVDGDVNVDPYADPNVNIFALTGLGDSANFTAIYDKGGLSARVAYNWRDKYLSGTNQGGNRNPLFTDTVRHAGREHQLRHHPELLVVTRGGQPDERTVPSVCPHQDQPGVCPGAETTLLSGRALPLLTEFGSGPWSTPDKGGERPPRAVQRPFSFVWHHGVA